MFTPRPLATQESLALLQVEPPVLGSRDPPVTEFMAPGFILSLAFFCAIATAALTLVLERKDGLLERSLVSGESRVATTCQPRANHVLTTC